MPTDSTANLEALIREEANRQRAAATAFETNMSNAVAEWAQHQAATRIALEHRLADAKDEAELARAHAQDLQKQLDAAMARIRELEGEPAEPPAAELPSAGPPVLALAQIERDGKPVIAVHMQGGARDHDVAVTIRTKADSETLVIPAGQTVIYFEGTARVPLRPTWEYWVRGTAGDQAGDEVRIQLRAGEAARPPGDKPDLQAWLATLPEPVYVQPPANARIVEDASQIDAALKQNEKDKHPLLIRNFRRVGKQINVEVQNANVWIEDGEVIDIKAGNGAIRVAPGASNVHINRVKFRGCAIGIYFHSTDTTIVGCDFREGSQAIHAMWYSAERPARNVRIEHNRMHALTGHDVELQTEHGNQAWIDIRPRVVGAVFRYNVSTGKPAWRDGMPNEPHRRMVFSIATGGAAECVMTHNWAEGGDAAVEAMNGWHMDHNVIVNSNHGFYINSKSTDYTIGENNVFINVVHPVTVYKH